MSLTFFFCVFNLNGCNDRPALLITMSSLNTFFRLIFITLATKL